MEALTILLISITSTLGFVALSVGALVLNTDRQCPAEHQRMLASLATMDDSVSGVTNWKPGKIRRKTMSNNSQSIMMRVLLSLIALCTMLAFTPGQTIRACELRLRGQQEAGSLAGNGYSSHRVPPPSDFLPGGLGLVDTRRWTVNYNPASCQGTTTAWPAAAQTAFEHAVDIWAFLIQNEQHIVIDACWLSGVKTTAGGSIVLGSATPPKFFRLSGPYRPGMLAIPLGLPVENALYPAALANELSGKDLDGSKAEIHLEFYDQKSTSGSLTWYFGLDQNPSWNQLDFVTTVLHEIGHGLGFLHHVNVDDGAGDRECNGTTGVGCWREYAIGDIYDPPPVTGVYTHFLEKADGLSLVYGTTQNTPELGAHLTGGALFFGGSFASQANHGSKVNLYAPSKWEPNSSVSHLDENTFNNTANALMTPSLDPGEAVHHPGPVALAILYDMGWKNVLTIQIKLARTPAGGTLLLPAGGYPETLTIGKPVRIGSQGGTVRIGVR